MANIQELYSLEDSLKDFKPEGRPYAKAYDYSPNSDDTKKLETELRTYLK